ncbi:MAG TPA: SDR family oxidoreductase [Micropepsaceae bacterium]|nr:SDR family oxidoreductase [Micropepsaceae bacterium]
MTTVLIVGARSDMARAIARSYARSGCELILAARNPDTLTADIADLKLRHGAAARAVAFDVLNTQQHGAFLGSLGTLPDTIVCVVGLMGDQAQSERDVTAADLVMRTNYTGPALLFAEAANRMAARGFGRLIGVSSVAGERGRARNYVYGSAKAGFTAYLSGLRQRLAQAGSKVQVMTVLPGFVRTSALADMETPGFLTAEPDEVAAAIRKAEAKGRERIYVRPVWRLVMAVIRGLPEPVFKKVKL